MSDTRGSVVFARFRLNAILRLSRSLYYFPFFFSLSLFYTARSGDTIRELKPVGPLRFSVALERCVPSVEPKFSVAGTRAIIVVFLACNLHVFFGRAPVPPVVPVTLLIVSGTI